MTKRGRYGRPLLSKDSRGIPTSSSPPSLICHRSRARGLQTGSPLCRERKGTCMTPGGSTVTKKGLYVGQEPYYCAISCGFLQNLSINPRFFRSVYASRKKDDPSPFCHRSGPKFFRPSLVVCLQTEDLSGGRTGIHIANAAWGVKRCVGHGTLRFSFQLFSRCSAGSLRRFVARGI